MKADAMTTFHDNHVLITGAAGALGLAVSTLFRDRGARLTLVDRELAPLRAAGFADSQCHALDLLDPDALRAGVDRAIQMQGPIDVACHLAGGFRMGESVHETTAQTWDFLLNLNARSFINLAGAVVPGMKARRSGAIVCVGAAGGLKGGAQMGAYAASKSALARLVESLSAELLDDGIHVNCVLPSIIDTPPNRAAMPGADASRWVAPSDLAEVIGFLASPAARAIHGAAIPVLGRVS